MNLNSSGVHNARISEKAFWRTKNQDLPVSSRSYTLRVHKDFCECYLPLIFFSFFFCFCFLFFLRFELFTYFQFMKGGV